MFGGKHRPVVMVSGLLVLLVLPLVRLVLSSCEAAKGQFQYCVLGAGPAGLQMGHFLSKAHRDYIILERNSGPGSFFHRYPRHRKLISINKIHTGRQNPEFNLRHDWNSLLSDRRHLLFRQVSADFYPLADAFPLYLSMFQNQLGLKVRYGVDVGSIRAQRSSTGERTYVLKDQTGTGYRCSVLLVATGLWVPQQVDFVGSDLVEGYESMSTDPEEYRDQAVLILGKGNSAFETAQSIMGRASRVHMLSSSPVRLAWQTHYVGDLRAVNNELLDTYQLKSLDGLVEAELEKVVIAERQEDQDRSPAGHQRKKKKKRQLYVTLSKFLQEDKKTSGVRGEELVVHHVDNFSLRKPYDRVIRCLGFAFNFSVFHSSARLPRSHNAKGRLPAVTAWYEGWDTPGMFVLGTAAHSRDHRVSAGGFVHGFRYTVRAVHRVLEHRYHGNAWPSTNLLSSQLLLWILKRVSEASGPYQMVQVLGDVVLLRGSHSVYLEEFPVQALPQFSSLSGHQVSDQGLLVLLLQYGKKKKKKVDFLGRGRAETDWTKAWKSNFLHPVLYFYRRLPTESEMKLRPYGWALPRPDAIHHMVEDFLSEWDTPLSHVQPLRRFLEHCLTFDLRAFTAESCFSSALSRRAPPLSCQQGYMRQRGSANGRRLQSNTRGAWLMSIERDAAAAASDDPALPSYLASAGASVSSGLKLDL